MNEEGEQQDLAADEFDELQNKIEALEAENARLMHVIDRDRYAAAIVLNNFKVLLRGWDWLRGPARGCYEYDDQTYQREFGGALDAFDAALGPLAKLAWDKTDCTTDPEKVAEAQVAGRLRAAGLAAPALVQDGPYGPQFVDAKEQPK